MRTFEERKAEVFRRSEIRIRKRKAARNHILTWCLCLCFIITISSAAVFFSTALRAADKSAPRDPNMNGASSGGIKEEVAFEPGKENVFGSLDSFSFSLTWGCMGISSYDSETGKLVKMKEASIPEDYMTTYRLTEAQKQKIYDLILNLNVTSYPDQYNPHPGGLASKPSMTLILSVKTDRIEKTITAADIALTFESDSIEGQHFLNVCRSICDILMETKEWKALPEYEFFFD